MILVSVLLLMLQLRGSFFNAVRVYLQGH
jgi:hypothetical protein